MMTRVNRRLLVQLIQLCWVLATPQWAISLLLTEVSAAQGIAEVNALAIASPAALGRFW